MNKEDRKYLRFTFQGETYQFNCLPFSLSPAPWVFTKALKPALALLRQMGIRFIAYIDDILILAESQEIALDHTSALTYLLQCLGFVINHEKSVLRPTRKIKFLGITVDSAQSELRLPLRKIKAIRAEARQIARQQATSAHELARLLGKMSATASVIPPAPLFYRHLQMDLA